MNPTILILLTEAAILILMGFILFAALLWRKNKQQAIELESLLNEFNRSEPERKTTLLKHLTDNRHIQTDNATQISHELLGAEKQFLQFFIRYRLGKGSGAEFYDQLSELLDRYLKLIPITEPQIPLSVPDPNSK